MPDLINISKLRAEKEAQQLEQERAQWVVVDKNTYQEWRKHRLYAAIVGVMVLCAPYFALFKLYEWASNNPEAQALVISAGLIFLIPLIFEVILPYFRASDIKDGQYRILNEDLKRMI